MSAVRLATVEDIDELVRMRWDFSQEENPQHSVDYREFYPVCSAFLQKALTSGDWYIWIAEKDDRIVSNMYLQLIHKVPRPGAFQNPYYAYVTNVYTRPDYRSQGIGTAIHRALEQWAQENHVEFLILWPSEKSGVFYARNGFSRSREALEKHF
ncbi:UNVERIFIED_CONTAM: GNAT superfamily N-acetyltransferase [Brevibacillus sp. OAP136]